MAELSATMKNKPLMIPVCWEEFHIKYYNQSGKVKSPDIVFIHANPCHSGMESLCRVHRDAEIACANRADEFP